MALMEGPLKHQFLRWNPLVVLTALILFLSWTTVTTSYLSLTAPDCSLCCQSFLKIDLIVSRSLLALWRQQDEVPEPKLNPSQSAPGFLSKMFTFQSTTYNLWFCHPELFVILISTYHTFNYLPLQMLFFLFTMSDFFFCLANSYSYFKAKPASPAWSHFWLFR